MRNFAAAKHNSIRYMKKVIILWMLLLAVGIIQGQESGTPLSLDSCRNLAITGNKEMRQMDNEWQAASYERKAAFTKFLPRISATGAYTYTSREFSLLSSEQKQALNGLGTSLAAIMPDLKGMAAPLNSVGASLVEALHTDTRHMGLMSVMLTQPIYMGGRIAAYHRITRYAEQVAARKQDLTLQDLIVRVDEAYWQIVSLQSRKALAESYLKLTTRLDNDLQQMIAQGVATQADGLSVKVKVNEARVTLIQVNNGLELARMLLCQLCALPLDTPIRLADEVSPNHADVPLPLHIPTADAMAHRPELNMLELSIRIQQEKVKLARGTYLPTVSLMGGYMASNPSVFNSFERQLKGMWNVGVMVNVPLVTFGERRYKIRAAQHEAKASVNQWEETREKVELQVSQSRQRVQEAAERLQTAHRSCDEADENLRFANLGLQEGVIPVSNVIEAQTAWLQAHAEQVNAQIDLRLANLYLLKSVGEIQDPRHNH